MDDHYSGFNCLTVKLCQVFSVTFDVKHMHNQWNWLTVLIYLGTLNPVYSSAKPHIMGSCAVSSLPKIYHFLKYVVPGMSPTLLQQSQIDLP